jgi:hypothetical protein
VLKLILDQDFIHAPPAVDASTYGHHGRIVDLLHHSDGRSPGSGALDFTNADAAVRIAPRPAWHRLDALAVEAVVLLRPSAGRRNVVEGDGSFAFYVDGDDTLVASMFSTVDGAPAPAWNVVSSRLHGPDGAVRTVPTDRWCKIVLHHDGITRCRLFIDDELVAVRSDYRSGLASVGAAGVVIGNWTLASQYAFDGLIDRVRIWKRDEDALVRDFAARLDDPAARDHWDDVWACLGAMDGETRERFAGMARAWDDLLRDMFRALHAAEDDERDRLLEALDTYRRNWRANTIDDPSHADALAVLHSYLRDRLGPGWIADFRGLAEGLRDMLAPVARCFDGERLAEADPAFARFIERSLPIFG